VRPNLRRRPGEGEGTDERLTPNAHLYTSLQAGMCVIRAFVRPRRPVCDGAMNRFLVAVGAVLLATGCQKESEDKRECQLEAVDLSSCNRAGLASVEAGGLWNVNVVLPDGNTPVVMSLREGNRHVFGVPIAEQKVEGETFYLGSDFKDSTGQTVRFALVGCEAPTPQQVKGIFRRCVEGTADLKGTFEAARLGWRTGEQEAQGVELVGQVAVTAGVPVDVHVSGGVAFVSALEGGLFIFDVSNPAAPVKKASLTPEKNVAWYQSWLKDTTLYIASSVGVLLYDVSDVAAPRYLKTLPVQVDARALAVDGNRLYVAAPLPRADVLIYNVTNATEPSLLSRYLVPDSIAAVGDVPVGLFPQGNTLYIGHLAYGLAVADVTDGSKVTKAGQYRYDGATSRSVVVGTFGQRTLAFESGESWGAHVRVLDVTTPSHITQAGAFSLRPGTTVSGLSLVGTKLYVAHNQDGLRVLDISNPSEPRQVGYYNTWREADAGRGKSFLEGLSSVRAPGDGYLYGTETSRGLLIFREQG